MKHTGTTSTSTFLQGLFLQYLHKVVITILCLQPSLTVSVHKDILHHLYEGISTVIHLLSSLLASLRGEILQSSLLTSLRNKFRRLSLPVSLWNEIYDHLHLHLYEVNLYSHLHWHLYGKYSYDVSTKISLRSHLYHQNLKCFYNIFGDLWLHLNK